MQQVCLNTEAVFLSLPSLKLLTVVQATLEVFLLQSRECWVYGHVPLPLAGLHILSVFSMERQTTL